MTCWLKHDPSMQRDLRRPYHEQVFLLYELDEVISKYGLPEDIDGGYDGYVQRPFEQYIEVQLWSDEPVARWLPGALGPR